MSSSVEMGIRLERPIVPKHRQTDLDIAIEIRCTETALLAKRDQVVNLCLAIDCSSSMEGEKMATAIECASRLTTQLNAADRLTVVSFADDAKVVTNPDVSRKQAADEIAKLKANGSTDLAAGYRLSLLEIQTHGKKEFLNRILLMTDGQANRGETKSSVLAAEAQRASEMGISTTCIGIGDDFAHELLHEIASQSDGNFYWVQQDQLDTIIEHESRRAISTQVINATLQLELPPGVLLLTQSNKLRLVTPLTYRLPPLESKESARFGYRLRVNPHSTLEDSLPIRGRVTVLGRELARGETRLRLGTEREYVDAAVDDTVVLTREQFRLANEEMRLAHFADDGDMDQLRQGLSGARNAISVARSRMDERNAGPMDDELGQLSALDEVMQTILVLKRASNDSAFSRWIDTTIAPRLQKLMRYRASKHDKRGMGAGIDDPSLQSAFRDISTALLAKAREILRAQPTNAAITTAIQRLERF